MFFLLVVIDLGAGSAGLIASPYYILVIGEIKISAVQTAPYISQE